MFCRTLLSLLRVCFLTDVEGDIHYFNRFMHISKILRWRDKTTHNTVYIPERMLNVNVLEKCEIDFQQEFVPILPTSATQCHMEKVRKANNNSGDEYDSKAATSAKRREDNRDCKRMSKCEHISNTENVTHFVYGGDACDHGDDLTFARLLLDFKARYPHRVHLMLGNRDLNKLVLGPLVQCVSDLTPEEAQHRAFPLTRLTGSLHPQIISYREFLERHYNKQMHKEERENESEKKRNSNSKTVECNCGLWNDKKMESMMSDKVSFLQWALKYKMGCTDTFEHRRNELTALAHTTHCKHNFSDNDNFITEEEVAESFFAAIKPGGVYYDYMHEGELMLKLSSLLFVHGGINEINLRFVPLLHARHEREHQLDKSNSSDTKNAVNGGKQEKLESPLPDKEQETQQEATTQTKHKHEMEEEEKCFASEEEIVLANNANGSRVYGRQLESEEINEWIDVLHQFKEDSLTEWEDAMNKWSQANEESGNSTSNKSDHTNSYYTTTTSTSFVGGEVLRQYCYPRLWAPHSVVVNSFIGLHGPQYSTLPVISYLLQNGVQVVCSGHQPCGDSPTLLFQPPHGSFVLIDGDNSYCSRGTEPPSSSSKKMSFDKNDESITHNKKQEEQRHHCYGSIDNKENEHKKLQESIRELTCKSTNSFDNTVNKAHITNTSSTELFSENKEQMKAMKQINRRGAAVQEIIFEVEDMEEQEEKSDEKNILKISGTQNSDSQHADVSENRIAFNKHEEDNYHKNRNESDSCLRVWVHGKRSDGRCFAFDASPATCFSTLTFSSVQDEQTREQEHNFKSYLGRRMKDGWWVKIPLSQCDYDAWQLQQQQESQDQTQNSLSDSKANSDANQHKERNLMMEINGNSVCSVKYKNTEETKYTHDKEDLAALIRRIQSTEVVAYELHRTSNAFRSEEVKVVTVTELQKMLLEEQQEQQQDAKKHDGCFSVGGELVSRWSTEELAYKEIHRLKTKVTPTNV